MELEEEVVTHKLQLAGRHFQLRNWPQCITLYSELVDSLRERLPEYLLKARQHHGLSAQPVVGVLIHPRLPTALDHRAAVFEKCKRYSDALADAREALCYDPLDPRPYLRQGKIYTALGKPNDAYKVYQRGVALITAAIRDKGVEVPARLWETLRAQYKKLRTELKKEGPAEPKAPAPAPVPIKKSAGALQTRGLQARLDAMLPLKRPPPTLAKQPSKQRKPRKNTLNIVERFPPEVIEQIFCNVPLTQRLKCHLVCKAWYTTLTSIPGLYLGYFALRHKVSALEYSQGLKLMRRVALYHPQGLVVSLLVSSTVNVHHLGRIIESVVSDSTLRLQRLHIVNRDLSVEMLVRELARVSYSTANLASIKHLRLGVNGPPGCQHTLLAMFPQAESLDLICVDKVKQHSNANLLPPSSTEFLRLHATHKTHLLLRRLVLVNNPALKGTQPNASGPDDSSPPFLGFSFPNLEELVVASYDLDNKHDLLLLWLQQLSRLKLLFVEDLGNCSMKQMLLCMDGAQFQLESLTIRENSLSGPWDFAEAASYNLHCLHSLKHLDVYGSLLTGEGLLRLLSTTCPGQLHSLNIGHCTNIRFRNDSLRRDQVIEFGELFVKAPGLSHLYLPELDLDNLLMRLLGEAAGERHFAKLDLSFCRIDGAGLVSLFGAGSKTNELVLHGLNFNPRTLAHLSQREYVAQIANDQFRTKWRQYGENSWVIQP